MKLVAKQLEDVSNELEVLRLMVYGVNSTLHESAGKDLGCPICYQFDRVEKKVEGLRRHVKEKVLSA